MNNQAILNLIIEEWEKLPTRYKPPCVWIRQYPAIPLEVDELNDLTMFARRVWFLDNKGLREENVWKWRRFAVVQTQPLWAMGRDKISNPVWGHPHEIGVAGFAPYLNSDKFYVEMSWGNRYGSGWQVTIDENGKAQRERMTWIS